MIIRKSLQRLVLASIAICVALLCLAGIGYVSNEDKKRLAHKQCEAIAMGAEAYLISSSSSLPPLQTLHDLARPADGGQSYLRHGEADLVDPWGKQYEMERRLRTDGSIKYILVKTTAPDGTLITQFGIGPKAEPPQK